MLAACTLWNREIVRFLRQPSRLASAIATPLIFWVLIGSGLTASFQLPGGSGEMSFLEYFFPGTLVLLVLFASIFANISVIEDRHEGFLQAVLVAPVSTATLVLGKVSGGATLAWLQGAVFLALAPAAGLRPGVAGFAAALGVLALLALGLAALGFAMAWKVDSTQGFHAVMNLMLIPMWMLSGAFFPLAGAPAWLGALMRINPLTYGVAALRHTLYSSEVVGEVVGEVAGEVVGEVAGAGMPSMATSMAVLVAATVLAVVVAVLVAGRGR